MKDQIELEVIVQERLNEIKLFQNVIRALRRVLARNS